MPVPCSVFFAVQAILFHGRPPPCKHRPSKHKPFPALARQLLGGWPAVLLRRAAGKGGQGARCAAVHPPHPTKAILFAATPPAHHPVKTGVVSRPSPPAPRRLARRPPARAAGKGGQGTRCAAVHPPYPTKAILFAASPQLMGPINTGDLNTKPSLALARQPLGGLPAVLLRRAAGKGGQGARCAAVHPPHPQRLSFLPLHRSPPPCKKTGVVSRPIPPAPRRLARRPPAPDGRQTRPGYPLCSNRRRPPRRGKPGHAGRPQVLAAVGAGPGRVFQGGRLHPLAAQRAAQHAVKYALLAHRLAAAQPPAAYRAYQQGAFPRRLNRRLARLSILPYTCSIYS